MEMYMAVIAILFLLYWVIMPSNEKVDSCIEAEERRLDRLEEDLARKRDLLDELDERDDAVNDDERDENEELDIAAQQRAMYTDRGFLDLVAAARLRSGHSLDRLGRQSPEVQYGADPSLNRYSVEDSRLN